MSENQPPRGPYRGPPSQPRDKRERARDRDRERGTAQGHGPRDGERGAERGGDRGGAVGRPPSSAARRAPPAYDPEVEAAAAPREQRLYGLNACLAMFAKRPQDLRKAWLLESRIPALKAVLAHCVANRIGYRVVGEHDLQKLAASSHHEGVVFDTAPAPEASLSGWLRALPAGPALAVWLDGVGNPHNLGAILRSCAHFGVAGLLLPKEAPLALSGAAARVAEGGAEQVPMVRLGRADDSLAQLTGAGFVPVATVVRGGAPLYGTALPGRLLLMMGAEQQGMDPALAGAAALRLGIPGTGAVESLNVAAATAVFLGEWWRQHHG